MITVIWGRSGSGKTKNIDYLKHKYKAKRVIDEWPNTDMKAADGDLLFTQSPSSAPKGATIIHIDAALKE